MRTFILVLLVISLSAHLNPTHLNAVNKVIKRYKRQLSVLEIGMSCEYTLLNWRDYSYSSYRR